MESTACAGARSDHPDQGAEAGSLSRRFQNSGDRMPVSRSARDNRRVYFAGLVPWNPGQVPVQKGIQRLLRESTTMPLRGRRLRPPFPGDSKSAPITEEPGEGLRFRTDTKGVRERGGIAGVKLDPDNPSGWEACVSVKVKRTPQREAGVETCDSDFPCPRVFISCRSGLLRR